jgi:pimeloyl-ACP methyl ester carboxylesterase
MQRHIKNYKAMKCANILLILVSFSGLSLNVTFAQDQRMHPEHLSIKRLNDSYIDAYYNKPAGNSPKPLLLFCQGSGVDSNTEGVLQLLQLYADDAVGIAIEKQGVEFGAEGGLPSEEYTRYNSIHNRVYDYLRLFQYLRRHAAWWNGEVYVIGGSEGGLIAGMLATMYPNVKGVAILCYGGGLSFGEAWPQAVAIQEMGKGNTPEAIDNAVQIARDSLAEATLHPTTQLSYSGRDNSYAWWASIVDLRLLNSLIDVDVPIFIGHGSLDQMAPVISAHIVRNTFDNEGKTNLKYVEYAGYEHSFTDQQGDNHLVEVFMEALNWIIKSE